MVLWIGETLQHLPKLAAVIYQMCLSEKVVAIFVEDLNKRFFHQYLTLSSFILFFCFCSIYTLFFVQSLVILTVKLQLIKRDGIVLVYTLPST